MLLLFAGVATGARADAPPEEPPETLEQDAALEQEAEEAPELQMRPWGAAFALVPGFGLGHIAAGQRRTGLRLMAATLGGLGALVVGVGGAAITGASRRTILPFYALSLAGFASFAFGWISDIAGTLSGGGRGRAAQRSRAEVYLGGRFIHDPQFEYGPFADFGGVLRRGRFEGRLDASLALGQDNQRVGLGGSVLLLGAEARATSARLRSALTLHRFGSEGFQSLAAELALGGRLALDAIGPSLAGTFIEGELGLGLQFFGYEATGGGLGEDTQALFLMRAAYGVFLGDGRGEIRIEYDHRRDDFAGALSVNSIGAGILGHVGVHGVGWFGGGSWGLDAFVEYGSAWIAGLHLRHRWLP